MKIMSTIKSIIIFMLSIMVALETGFMVVGAVVLKVMYNDAEAIKSKRDYGIVEFKDRVRRIEPWEIKFIDETNDILKELEKMQAAKEKMDECDSQ